jgi:hypothetical protein
MRLRTTTFALLALFALPAAAVAGPIEFGLGAGNLTYTNPNPGADTALVVPIPPPGGVYNFDPATGTPVPVNILSYMPRLLPASPAWSTLRPDGTVHWDVNGYYGQPLTLTDTASGEAATFTFYGQAHMVADFSPATGWTGYASFSSQDWHQVRLGGNLYSIWGLSSPTAGPAAVDVWVGNGVPPMPQYTPEPTTFALAALGLIPFGIRGLRRKW